MRIGYYFAQTQQGDGGIYQYALYILKMLVNNPEVKSLLLIYSSGQEELLEEYALYPHIRMKKHKRNGIIYQFFYSLADFILKRYYLKGKKNTSLKKLSSLLNPDQYFFNRLKIDILQVPRQLSPIYNLKYPVLITMHDLQQLYFPEFFSPMERMYKAISYYIAIEESDHVIVSYQHVKDDIVKYFRIAPDKVSLCEVPVDINWYSSEDIPSPEDIRKKYKLPEKFIMTPAATWPHKNHIAVIHALKILKDNNMDLFWVSTGFQHPYYYEIIEPAIRNAGLESKILFTGIVPDKDLIALYHACSLVVIPTLYEAGSGPLFEAMRYQVPVICSDVTSLPETIDNEEFTFDPKNTEKIAALIKKGLTDEEFRSRNMENSRKRMLWFQSKNYYTGFYGMYMEAIRKFREENR
jgi:glycosyltransferase involved in cell wall biosynthesis